MADHHNEQGATMMFLPSRDGFLTALQRHGHATVIVTSSDDLAIVVPAIQEHVATIGLDGKVRILLRGEALVVEARADA